MANENVDIKVTIEAAQAAKTLGELNNGLADMKTKLQNLDVGSDEFNKLNKAIGETEKKIQSTTNNTGLFATVFPNVAKGLDLLKKGTNAWGAALKSAGIGLVIALVAGLVESFKKLEPVMNIIEGVTRGIEQAFRSLVSLDFSNFFGNIEKAYESVELEKELEKSTAALAKTQATLNGEIEYQEKLADDTTKSAEERKAALNEAIKKNEELGKEQEANAIKNIEYLKEQARLHNNDTESVKKLAEAEAKQAEDRAKIRVKDQDLRNKDAAIDKEVSDKAEADKKEQEKKDEERRKKAAESEKDYQKRLRKLREENTLAFIEDEKERELKRLEFQKAAADEEIRALEISQKKKNDLLLANDIKYQSDRADIINKSIEKQEKEDEEKAKAAEEKRKQEEEKRKASDQSLLERQRQLTIDSIDDAFLKSQKELEIQKQRDMEALAQDENYAANKEAIDASYDIKYKALAKSRADYEKALEQQKVNAAIDTAGAVLGAVSGFLEEGSDAAKAVAVAQATMDTYKSANAAFSAVAGIPVVGPTLAPIAAGAAIAAGIANVKKIIETKPNKSSTPSSSSSPAPALPSPSSMLGSSTDIQFRRQTGQQEEIPMLSGSVTGGNQNNKPTAIRAYVVESEVTDVQRTVSRIKDRATIG